MKVSISEMKNEESYDVSIRARGSVWKKIETAAAADGITVNKWMMQAAKTKIKQDRAAADNDTSGMTDDQVITWIENMYPGFSRVMETDRGMFSITGLANKLGIKQSDSIKVADALINRGMASRMGNNRLRVDCYANDAKTSLRGGFVNDWVKIEPNVRVQLMVTIMDNAGAVPDELNKVAVWSLLSEGAMTSYWDDLELDLAIVKKQFEAAWGVMREYNVLSFIKNSRYKTNRSLFNEVYKQEVLGDLWEEYGVDYYTS